MPIKAHIGMKLEKSIKKNYIELVSGPKCTESALFANKLWFFGLIIS